MTNDTHDEPFDAKGVVCLHDNRLHRVVGGMEFDGPGLAVVGFDRGLPVHQGNDRLAIPRRLLLLHDDHITGENPIVAHGLALHPQREGLAASHHALRDIDPFRLRDRFDRFARRNDACELDLRSPEGIQQQFRHPGDAPGAVLVPDDRTTRGLELVGQLRLGQPELESSLAEVRSTHVTNGHIDERACQVRPPKAL